MNDSRLIHSLAERVLGWAKGDAKVQALFWFGSFSIHSARETSDLDAAVLMDCDADINRAIDGIRDALGADTYQIGPMGSSKAVFLAGHGLTKVDVTFARAPDDLAWLADAAEVPAPRLVLAFERNSKAGDLLNRAERPLVIDPSTRANQEIEKFLEGFEACSAAHRASDAYAFYFQYNLALGRLARLVQISRTGPERLYLPPQLTNRCLRLEERPGFVDLAGTMNLRVGNSAKRKLLQAFLAVTEELRNHVALRRTALELRGLGEAILRRDFFYNVRDWSEHMDGRIRSGILIRASNLARWKDDPYLITWLNETNVQLLIDLRSLGEGDEYPKSVLAGREYLRVPLYDTGQLPTQPPPAQSAKEYHKQFLRARPEVVRVFRAISQSSGTAVVHCVAGRDRTGWICALLGLVLGLPVKALVSDYMATRVGVTEDMIEGFISLVGGIDGARVLLSEAGLTDAETASLRRRFLPQ